MLSPATPINFMSAASICTNSLCQTNHSLITAISFKDMLFQDVDIGIFLQSESNPVDFNLFEHQLHSTLDSELPRFDVIEQNDASSLVVVQENVSGHGQVVQDFHTQNISHFQGIHDQFMGDQSSLTDLLLMAAEALEAGNRPLASTIAMRLNNILSDQENTDNPLDRLAFYFAQGLISKSLNTPELLEDPISWSGANAVCAFQMLQEISPYVKFAHFTANQAILEASEGHQEVHIIDFDIMEGIQWPPLMIDLDRRSEDASSLRITAVISDERDSSNIQQTGKRLQEFADSIGLHFAFDSILITREEDFEEISVSHTHILIANCMINQLHLSHRGKKTISAFFNGIRKLSPKIFVTVEEELFHLTRVASMSFVEFFCEALHHYTAISESILCGFCGAYKLAQRVIETEFLGKRILDSLKYFPCEKTARQASREEYPSPRGFRRIPMSSCNVTQAKFLVSLFSGGYWVQNEQCRLALFWKSRPLTTASVWVPMSSQSPPSSMNSRNNSTG